MNQGLDITQNQKTLLHLSPQQVQFVRLLEMNTAEIEEKVRRELDDNPALEAVDGTDNHAETRDSDTDGDGEKFDESAEQLMAADYRSEEDMPFDNHYAPSYSNDYNATPLDINADATSPVERLIEQLSDYNLTDAELTAAHHIIGNLDSNGRLTRSLTSIADDIAIADGVYIDEQTMHKAFDTVRSLDPPGVCATDLRDCLLLQLKRRHTTSLALRVATEIVDKHFDLLSHKHYERLTATLGIDNDTLRDALTVIRSLNPKPWAGADLDTQDRMRHVSADFIVERLDDGRYSVSLTQRLPTLDVEMSFRPESDPQLGKNKDGAVFIKRKREEATQFIDLIAKRSQTLLSVMRAIIELQPDFFATEETSRIRPMILKDVAALTNLDLSVISRATTGKYVSTGGGIYPLKLFFNERPKEDNDTSSHLILDTIRDIIAKEDGTNPLSDDAICKIMKSKGFDIARRTVAKYREKLSLPVARLRRKL